MNLSRFCRQRCRASFAWSSASVEALATVAQQCRQIESTFFLFLRLRSKSGFGGFRSNDIAYLSWNWAN